MAGDPILDGLDPSGRPRVQAIVAMTQALPADEGDVTKAYMCTMPVASMHREDGKRIGFMHGFYETNLVYDIKYLDNEIKHRHPHLRYATADEVRAHRMRTDPNGTIAAELRPKMEADIRASLEDEIMERMRQQGIDPEVLAKIEADMKPKNVDINLDAQKLSGTTTLSDKLAALRSGKIEGAVKMATGVLMPAQRAPITPVSTANLAGGAADSNSIPK